MTRRSEVLTGSCKGCGRTLMIEKHAGGGFTSHHQVPLCPTYEAVLAEMPPAKSVSVSEIEVLEPD